MTILLLTARALFSMLFVLSGASHLMHWRETAAQAAYEGLPLPGLLSAGGTGLLLVGGASVLLGAWTRVGAALLALFLVSASLLMHAFWRVRDPQVAQLQRIQFMKNLSLAGGALLFVYFGSGPLSLVP
jgi:putative oxidoreductase